MIGIILGIFVFLGGAVILFFNGKKYGKDEMKSEQMENSVKETLEIKKDEETRRNDPISAVRDRLRKFTRD